MLRPASLSLTCAIVTAAIWLANFVEAAVPITTCTLARMQVESYLLVARALAVVLPVLGLVLAAIAHRAGRMTVWAATINGLALLYGVGALLRWLLVNHFGCLRS